MKKVLLLLITMVSFSSVSATEISGDYYSTDNNPYCSRQPVAQVKVNFDLKTFKNSYIDDWFKKDNFVPPADQAFNEIESCYNPPGWDRQYCAVAVFDSNSVNVTQYYKDYGSVRSSFTLKYTFSENLTSLKISSLDGTDKCNYKLAVPREISKNDLLLKNGALFKVSKKAKSALSDPTGLHWVDVLRKNDGVVAVNYEVAKSYCESKKMRLPSTTEATILLYYLNDSTPIKVVGTNYLLEELFPEFSKHSYWTSDSMLYSNGGISWVDENLKNDPIDGTALGVRCVTR